MKKTKIKWLLLILLLGYIISGLYVSYVCAMDIKRSNEEIERFKIAQEEKKAQIDTMPIKELIASYGGSQAQIIHTIAHCESRLNPKAINYHDGGHNKHSVGILQFQEATFKEWSKRLGEELDYYSSYDQIKVAKYMIEKGQARQWSCARIMKVV